MVGSQIQLIYDVRHRNTCLIVHLIDGKFHILLIQLVLLALDEILNLFCYAFLTLFTIL